jgi:hypothetical protein
MKYKLKHKFCNMHEEENKHNNFEDSSPNVNIHW